MKKIFAIGFGTLSLGLMLFAAAPARAADYPNVSTLHPFTADCNYMSRAGYLRYMVFAQDGVWLSRAESVAIVQSQGTAAGE
ncbi:MAG TPA: hypothetical protein VGO93_02580 [Candidatus Xenobia bacterium]